MTIFDLEQEILRFGNILDDLDQPDSKENLAAIVRYYQIRNDKLWDTFTKHSVEYHKERNNAYKKSIID